MSGVILIVSSAYVLFWCRFIYLFCVFWIPEYKYEMQVWKHVKIKVWVCIPISTVGLGQHIKKHLLMHCLDCWEISVQVDLEYSLTSFWWRMSRSIIKPHTHVERLCCIYRTKVTHQESLLAQLERERSENSELKTRLHRIETQYQTYVGTEQEFIDTNDRLKNQVSRPACFIIIVTIYRNEFQAF